MRLFTAIELTDDARAAIGAEEDRLRATMARTSLRMVDPGQMHLTLSFIGEATEAQAEQIAAAMREPVPMQPFVVGFGGLGMFPPRGAPRILWLGVAEGAKQVITLQRLLAERLIGVGVVLEERPYHPHLTLGRWRDSRPSDRRHPDPKTPRVVARVPVDSATLFHSRLSPNGATHTAVVRAPLTGVH